MSHNFLHFQFGFNVSLTHMAHKIHSVHFIFALMFCFLCCSSQKVLFWYLIHYTGIRNINKWFTLNFKFFVVVVIEVYATWRHTHILCNILNFLVLNKHSTQYRIIRFQVDFSLFLVFGLEMVQILFRVKKNVSKSMSNNSFSNMILL